MGICLSKQHQVVPLPQDAGRSTAQHAAGKSHTSGTRHKSVLNKVVPATSADCTGLDDGLLRVPAVHGSFSASHQAASYPALQALLAACKAVSRAAWHASAAALQRAATAASTDMERACSDAAAGNAAAATLLSAVHAACTACVDMALQPLIPLVESGVAARAGGGWDTVTATQLLAHIRDATHATYAPDRGNALGCSGGGGDGRGSNAAPTSERDERASATTSSTRWLGGALLPLGRLLLMHHTHYVQPRGPGPSGWTTHAGVPAVDALLSMLGLVLFRHVALETQVGGEDGGGLVCVCVVVVKGDGGAAVCVYNHSMRG
jgi:hypothetical protein